MNVLPGTYGFKSPFVINAFECAQIIKRLLAGEEVTYTGWVKVRRAKLYTRPLVTPPLMCTALSKETAAWADGLLTTYQPDGKLEEIITAFRTGGGEGKPVHVKLIFSFSGDEQFALAEAHHQWCFDCIDKLKLAELKSVTDFDNATKDITLEKVASIIPISSSINYFITLIKKIDAMGVNHIVLHNVGRNQEDSLGISEIKFFRE